MSTFTFEEITNLIFDKFDTDKSGSIERKELKHLLEEWAKESDFKITEADVDDTLAHWDFNNDGVISRSEFLAMIKNIMGQ